MGMNIIHVYVIGPRETQTKEFVRIGCPVSHLNVALQTVPMDEMASKACCIFLKVRLTSKNDMQVDAADVILVSGGNTLFAVDRWDRLGLSDLLRKAAIARKVLTGGSAGVIMYTTKL